MMLLLFLAAFNRQHIFILLPCSLTLESADGDRRGAMSLLTARLFALRGGVAFQIPLKAPKVTLLCLDNLYIIL